MSNKSVKDYFNTHTHDYGRDKDPTFYKDLSNYILQIKPNHRLNILDIGCGSGSFIKAIIECGVVADFVGIDISERMIQRAESRLKQYHNIHLQVMDLCDIDRKLQHKFDVIHMGSVLHHLIARTQSESKKLAKSMIKQLMGMLEIRGALVIEEVFYYSYIIPHLTSKLVFYGLKLLNRLNLDLNRFVPQVQLGLEVSFLSDDELRNFLKEHSAKVTRFRKESWSIPRVYRYFLLTDCGHMTYIASRT